jgi:hypothetical protein
MSVVLFGAISGEAASHGASWPLALGIGIVGAMLITFALALAFSLREERNVLRGCLSVVEAQLAALTSDRAYRATPAFLGHVQTIQDYARTAFESVYSTPRYPGERRPNYQPINAAGVGFADFKAHFPTAGAAIEEWNSAAEGYQEAAQGLPIRLRKEGERLGIDATDSGLAGLLRLIAIGAVQAREVMWNAEDGRLWARPPDDLGTYLMGNMPTDLRDASHVLSEIGASINSVRTLPEVRDWHRFNDLIAELRPRVGREIEAAAHTHSLPGECDRCPRG